MRLLADVVPHADRRSQDSFFRTLGDSKNHYKLQSPSEPRHLYDRAGNEADATLISDRLGARHATRTASIARPGNIAGLGDCGLHASGRGCNDEGGRRGPECAVAEV